METKDKIKAIESLLKGMRHSADAAADLLNYKDDSEFALTQAISAIDTQIWATLEMMKRIPF